jgi:hypothetical protein
LCEQRADPRLCYLCGEPIELQPEDPGSELSMDHVPPKQFFPKELRDNESLNLWVAPTHRRCNEGYRADEEYFYHCMYPLVGKINPRMGMTIFRDFERRARKPQTPAMLRRILSTCTTVTEGGIYLPSGIVQFKAHRFRIQNVVLKIARGLFYLDHQRYIPRENAKDIRLCETEDEVPEFYKLTWQATTSRGVYPPVFSFRQFYLDVKEYHLWSMLFWGSIMFCTTFEDTQVAQTA